MRKSLSIFLILLAAKVFAGNEKGNGGTILDCNGKIVFADFEEVKHHPSLKGKITILEKDSSVDDQIDSALKRLGQLFPSVEERARLVLKDFNGRVQISGDEYEWMTSGIIDLPDFPLPKGCTPKTTIMYFDSGLIDMKLHLLEPLTNTHEAGLRVHEVVNRMIRATGEKFSAVPGRRITEFLFAENPDREILKSLITRYMANIDGRPSVYLSLASGEDLALTYLRIDVDVEDYGYGRFYFSPWNQINFSQSFAGYTDNGTYRTLSHQQPGDFFLVSLDFVEVVKSYEVSLMKNNDPKSQKFRSRFQQKLKSNMIIFNTEEESQRMKLFIGTFSTNMNSFIGPQ